MSDGVLQGAPATKQKSLVGYVIGDIASLTRKVISKKRERSSQINWRMESGTARMLSFGPAFRGRKGSLELHHELKPSRESKEDTRGGGKFTDIVPDQMHPLVTVKSKSKSKSSL